MILEYPSEFPGEAVSMVLDKVTGKDVDTEELIHAGWHVLGFALGKVSSRGIMPSYGETSGWDDGDLLRAAMADSEAGPDAKGAIPWVLVIRLVVKLLQEYST